MRWKYWKRVDYLTHRWIGIVLGAMVLVWFASGIVLMYYPYPALTESQQLHLLTAYAPDARLIGCPAAVRAAAAAQSLAPDYFVGARLEWWDGRPLYQLWRERRGRPEAAALVDARTGTLVTPISRETAARIARIAVGPVPPLERVDLLARSDHYVMGSEFRGDFPVYRVRFGDARSTAVYVSQNHGGIPAVVTRVTRLTTWTGTVPHWLYFMWLYYDYPGAWTWVNLVLPGVAVALGLTGVFLGTYQLFPRRRRREWRVSGYHGVSLWHHVSGIVFGALVLTWSLSGLLEVLGLGNDPRPGQADVVRGGAVRWGAMRVGEAAAWARLRQVAPGAALPKAIDCVQYDGRPGYKFLLEDDRAYWVDAETGTTRGELTPEAVHPVAGRLLPAARVVSVERLDHYDAYYYARHGRQKHLPAWRVRFDDPDRSVLYLDTVSGVPVGFMDREGRSWRWWRDGLHDLDVPALNNNRPWWDLVVLPLMIGGTVSAITGIWLLVRRLRRMTAA